MATQDNSAEGAGKKVFWLGFLILTLLAYNGIRKRAWQSPEQGQANKHRSEEVLEGNITLTPGEISQEIHLIRGTRGYAIDVYPLGNYPQFVVRWNGGQANGGFDEVIGSKSDSGDGAGDTSKKPAVGAAYTCSFELPAGSGSRRLTIHYKLRYIGVAVH